MRLVPSLALCLLACPALAWEHTVEWRFQGPEIASFRVITPDFDEDPVRLEVSLSHQHYGDTVVTIEADNGLGECADTLSYAQGNPFVTVVLTANLNAQTMNGTALVQCSTR